MKRKQLSEFHTKSMTELANELKTLKSKQMEAQVAVVTGKDRNVKDLRNLRRDIAQILSIISYKSHEKIEEKEVGKEK